MTTGRPFAYMLAEDGRTPLPFRLPQCAEDWDVLLRWVERSDGGTMRLARHVVGLITVSTSFMGCDMSSDQGPPLLWETALLGDGGYVRVVGRYASWEDARAGHDEAVREVTAGRL